MDEHLLAKTTVYLSCQLACEVDDLGLFVLQESVKHGDYVFDKQWGLSLVNLSHQSHKLGE